MSQHSADPAEPQSRRWTRGRIASLALVVGVFAVAGCGSSKSTSSSSSSATSSTPAAPANTSSSSESQSPGASGALSLSANSEGQLSYSTTSLSAKAGKVAIDFTNMAPLSHNVTVESASGAVVGSTPTFQGASKTLNLNLKPGTYKFFCSVPGHRQAGMEGTLVVK